MYENGELLTDSWCADGNLWYHLGPDGKMSTGLTEVKDGSSSDGYYYFSKRRDGTYGHVESGWKFLEGTWYYFNEKHDGSYGRMATSEWLNFGNTWNHVGQDGKMDTGLTHINDGTSADGWYYFNPKRDGNCGKMETGWKFLDGEWYYFNDKKDDAYGRMVTSDWVGNGNTWYHTGSDGKMDVGLTEVKDGKGTDGLYYFNPSHDGTCGKILSGWQEIDGELYYFETRHNGYYGRGYVNGTYVIDGKSYTFDEYGHLV